MRQLRRASSNANDEIPSRVPPLSLSKGPAGMWGIKMGVMVVEGEVPPPRGNSRKEWELSGIPNHDSTFLIWKGTWMRPVTVSSPVGDSESTKSVDLSGQTCPLGKSVSREIQVADKSLSGSTFLNQRFLLSPTHTSLWCPATPQNKVWTLPCDRVIGKWSEPHLPVNGLQRTFYSTPSHFLHVVNKE